MLIAKRYSEKTFLSVFTNCVKCEQQSSFLFFFFFWESSAFKKKMSVNFIVFLTKKGNKIHGVHPLD